MADGIYTAMDAQQTTAGDPARDPVGIQAGGEELCAADAAVLARGDLGDVVSCPAYTAC